MSNQQTASAAIELLIQLLTANGPVSQLISSAHAAGRTISREELETAFAQDDVARASLVDAIHDAGG
jgi:hypothetical protein